jgi:hypothetical protein
MTMKALILACLAGADARRPPDWKMTLAIRLLSAEKLVVPSAKRKALSGMRGRLTLSDTWAAAVR